MSVEYEKIPFFKDIYKYLTEGHIPSEITGHALRKPKTECEYHFVIDDVLFRIKSPKGKSIEPSLLLVIPEIFVPITLYQYHDSLLAGHQGVNRMYLTLMENSMLTTYSIPSESTYKVVIYVTQDLLMNQVINPIKQELLIILDLHRE